MMTKTIKGIERLMTAQEVAEVLRRPLEWVRENLLKTGVLEASKIGGNSWRVKPSVLQKFIDGGFNGFRNIEPSGMWKVRQARGNRRAV